MKADNPVHPVTYKDTPQAGASLTCIGLTVRDHTAIEAMNGMVSSESDEDGYYNTEKGIQALVSRAYKIADAMILESNK